jgi:hypothetical protein
LDLGLSHRQTVLLIYGLCTGLAVLALILTGVTQLYAFIAVFIASGLVLFLPTRGDFDRPDELEAEAYEPNHETADSERSPVGIPVRPDPDAAKDERTESLEPTRVPSKVH